MSTNLITEHVEQPYYDGHGAVTVERFWIAYPEHVHAYAYTDDRINRATGRGKLKRDAIASAAAGGAWIDTAARSTRMTRAARRAAAIDAARCNFTGGAR